MSRLRGWQGRGGGLKVRGGPARAAVDGLGQDGMESMEWRSELVMQMDTEEEHGWRKDWSTWAWDRAMGLDQHEHRRKLLWFEYISRNLIHGLEI